MDTPSLESFGATERETQASGCAGQVRSRVPGEVDESGGDREDDDDEAWRAKVPSNDVLRTSFVDVTATPQIAAECAGLQISRAQRSEQDSR